MDIRYPRCSVHENTILDTRPYKSLAHDMSFYFLDPAGDTVPRAKFERHSITCLMDLS